MLPDGGAWSSPVLQEPLCRLVVVSRPQQRQVLDFPAVARKRRYAQWRSVRRAQGRCTRPYGHHRGVRPPDWHR